jgi:hypothetical protein
MNKILFIVIVTAMCLAAYSQDDSIVFHNTKSLIHVTALLEKYGGGVNFAYFKFPYDPAFIKIGQIYEISYLQLDKSDSTKLSDLSFGGAIGVLFSGPTNPLSVLLDGKIGFGTSFGSTMSFSIGFGSSQLLMLRFGKDTRFVMEGGIFENARISETFPFDWGYRIGLGIEFVNHNKVGNGP